MMGLPARYAVFLASAMVGFATGAPLFQEVSTSTTYGLTQSTDIPVGFPDPIVEPPIILPPRFRNGTHTSNSTIGQLTAVEKEVISKLKSSIPDSVIASVRPLLCSSNSSSTVDEKDAIGKALGAFENLDNILLQAWVSVMPESLAERSETVKRSDDRNRTLADVPYNVLLSDTLDSIDSLTNLLRSNGTAVAANPPKGYDLASAINNTIEAFGSVTDALQPLVPYFSSLSLRRSESSSNSYSDLESLPDDPRAPNSDIWQLDLKMDQVAIPVRMGLWKLQRILKGVFGS